jgi:hypothetical protein
MLMQPRKLRRYLLGNPVFLFRMIRWLRADRLADAARNMAERVHTLMTTFGVFAFV